jgi:methionyl aminopeptidase
MTISIKSPEEIEKMRLAGRQAAEVLEMIEEHVRPGVSTEHLDQICHDYIVNRLRAVPAPLNYRGFPKSICTSVNHQVCHGIPGPKKLKTGDIVNIDITVITNGYHGDTSKMFLIGEASTRARRLVTVTQEAMYRGIQVVKPGALLRDIGRAIQDHAEQHGYSIVREFCGHGIGREFHEDPQVLHYYEPEATLELKPGMVFTIEPMINFGKRHVKILPDGWTAVTKDHSLSAQWEHTVVVNENGCEVLTLRQEEVLEFFFS